MKKFLFTLLALSLSACAGVVLPPYKSVDLRLLESAVNLTGKELILAGADLAITPGNTFKASNIAEIRRPLDLDDLTNLQLNDQITGKTGLSLTMRDKQLNQPLHAYLVLYPVYRSTFAPNDYQLKLNPQQLQQVKEGKVVKLYGEYEHYNVKRVSWVMWVWNKNSLQL